MTKEAIKSPSVNALYLSKKSLKLTKSVVKLLMIAKKFGIVDEYIRISMRVTEGVGGSFALINGTSAT